MRNLPNRYFLNFVFSEIFLKEFNVYIHNADSNGLVEHVERWTEEQECCKFIRFYFLNNNFF